MSIFFSGIFFTFFTLQTQAQPGVDAKAKTIAFAERNSHLKQFNHRMQSNASDNYTVQYYRCEWEVDPAVRYIKGKITVYFTLTAATSQLVLDLSDRLITDSVQLHYKPVISFTQFSNATLSIILPRQYAAKEQDSLSIYYQGVPPDDNGAFIQTTHVGTPVIWTLSEPYGAKDWWPCRNGLDDKADSIDIYVTHPSGYKTSSNGLLLSETISGNNKITHYAHRYPIASYLVAIAVTNYKVFTKQVQLGTVSLPVISYVYPENFDYFNNETHPVLSALQLYHTNFGDYPFIMEKYGHTQFGFGGGMEHQTNSFIVNADINLMAHELAHQWFGDKITCASWRDIWLNEGFATYLADFFFTEKTDTADYHARIHNNLADIVSQPGGSVWVDDTTNINRIFDGRLSYNKGAFLLRMLRFTLGDSIFFAGMRQYLQDPALRYGFAATQDFQRNMEAVSHIDLQYFFDQWFYQQGYPSFTVKWSQNRNNFAGINLSQVSSHPSVRFFKVPLQLTFKNSTQEKKFIIQQTQNNQNISLDIGFAADTVLIDEEQYLVSKNNRSIHQFQTLAGNQVQVYPNPFSNHLFISIKNPTEKKLTAQLYNTIGQKLWTEKLTTSGADEIFSLPAARALPHGVYIIKIFVGDKVQVVQKLVK